MVVRSSVSWLNTWVLARTPDAQVVASAKSWSLTLSKQSVTSFLIVSFSSPIVIVIRSGRRFHVWASCPSVMYFFDVASSFDTL